ncbi:endo-1,4-beta-xylanase [Rhizobium hainanense]|uniref:endo-1,4-beta-xylanase n=1 Tax=Rhizobium hainanense TaxID=52131 RepID=UPI000A00755D
MSAGTPPRGLLSHVGTRHGLEADDDGPCAKRQVLLAILGDILRCNVPIDAVGIQSHLRASDTFGPSLAHFILDVQNLGPDIDITELAVDDSCLEPSSRDVVVAGV